MGTVKFCVELCNVERSHVGRVVVFFAIPALTFTGLHSRLGFMPMGSIGCLSSSLER